MNFIIILGTLKIINVTVFAYLCLNSVNFSPVHIRDPSFRFTH